VKEGSQLPKIGAVESVHCCGIAVMKHPHPDSGWMTGYPKVSDYQTGGAGDSITMLARSPSSFGGASQTKRLGGKKQNMLIITGSFFTATTGLSETGSLL